MFGNFPTKSLQVRVGSIFWGNEFWRYKGGFAGEEGKGFADAL
jgi:hypothetical protein